MEQIDYSNFEKDVLNSQLPVVLDVYGEWCGPCKGFTPKLEKLAQEYHGKLAFFKIDMDKNEEFTEKYAVRSLPTMLVFSKGKVVLFKTGDRPEEEIKKYLDAVLIS